MLLLAGLEKWIVKGLFRYHITQHIHWSDGLCQEDSFIDFNNRKPKVNIAVIIWEICI